MKPFLRAFLVAILLALVSGSVLAQSPAASPETAPDNQNQSTSVANPDEETKAKEGVAPDTTGLRQEAAAKKLLRESIGFTEVFNSLLVLLNVCLLLVTNKAANAAKQAARATERSVQTMENTAKQQLRAYVHVCAVGLDDLSKRTYAEIKFKNFGQTPAHDVRVYGGLMVTSFPPGENLPAVDTSREDISVEPLAPSRESTKHEGGDVLLEESVVNEIRDGSKAIYAYGQIMYRDVFGHDQVTTYRYFAGGATGVRGGSMAAHEEGNHAT